jgi:nucleotide-binding universal stress UspA family protein
MLIAHLTDLSGDDEAAFLHAVALAARAGARLASVHACVGPRPERELPHAAEVLARWSRYVTLDHERIEHECCDDVTDTVLDALEHLQPDLVVSATHPRSWLSRLLSGSVAEGVARNLRTPTLLLPLGGSCFADQTTGELLLKRILVPAGDQEEAERGMRAAIGFARLCGADRAELVLLHAADGRAPPILSVEPGFTIVPRAYASPIANAVRAAIAELDPDVIVMGTHGHDTLDDVLLGSQTERVLHTVNLPMLWVPLTATVS